MVGRFLGGLVALLLAGTAAAEPWTIVAPADWTLDPDDSFLILRVDWWFTEGGSRISPLATSYLAPGRRRDVAVDTAHWNSGRTICLHARASRRGPLAGTRDAVPLCVTFDAAFSLRVPLTCPPTADP